MRVVDATTRKTMTDEAEVVFVPCADSEPIKSKNAALSQLPGAPLCHQGDRPVINNSTTSTAPSTSTMTI